MAEARRQGIEHDKLSQYLKTLANPGRLEILEQLRVPKHVSDIHVSPRRRESGVTQTRPMSRQSVLEHLEVLEAAGVVLRRPGVRHGRRVDEFLLNQQRLFAIQEELRRLTELRAAFDAGESATIDAEAAPTGLGRGPQLVLAGGPRQGKAFRLEPPETSWVIGRKRGLHVALDYDPYVSQENSLVTRAPDGWTLQDLAGSRNGTMLNFAPMAKGSAAPLRSGDFVGAGRSLLVFREA